MSDERVPCLVFAYQGFYVNVYADESFWAYEVIVEDTLLLVDDYLSRDRMSIGVLMEMIMARIDDMNAINQRYLN